MALLALAGCAGAPDGGPPAGRNPALAAAPVTVGDVTLTGAVGPGPDGLVSTAAGALRVPGARVTVTGALSPSDGRLAKEAAALACTAAGGVLRPRALGRFAGPGTWMFDGACG
jgi:hypothetical protein